MPSQMFSHVANSKAALRAPIVVVSLLIYAKNYFDYKKINLINHNTR